MAMFSETHYWCNWNSSHPEGLADTLGISQAAIWRALRKEGIHLLRSSESGFYAWLHRPASSRGQNNYRLELEIKAAHYRTHETYGPTRLQRDLADHKTDLVLIGLSELAENQVCTVARNGSSKQPPILVILYL